MTRREITRQARKMREDWDRRARENARYYVATGQDEWREEEFYRSGEVNLKDFVLNDLGNVCQGKDPKDMKVIEIGCGAGRITRALAGFFGRVYAVDISREMARQARQALAEFPNARVYRNNGKDLSVVCDHWWQRFGVGESLQLDFAFSYIVFQHIPSREVIENYVREAGRLLRPGGLFKFQVQGSPLAGESPNTWEGVPFNEQEAREMAQRCGFEMRHHRSAGDQYYWLWFFKKGGMDRNEWEERRRIGELDLKHHILSDLDNICQGMGPKDMKVLEIGCGETGIASAMEGYFGEVCAVDLGLATARPVVLRGRWWERLGFGRKRRFDFAFSQHAFERMASREKMESCLRGVHGVLRPGALFKFRVPGWGAVWGEREAREMAERCGFAMLYQESAGERDYWLWFFKHGGAGQAARAADRIGELTVEHHVLNDLTNVCQGKDPKEMRVLFEAGRGEDGITRALAGFFGEVRAVDAGGKNLLAARGGWRDRLRLGKKRQADFAFSYSAFQQMASCEGIESAVREVHRLLRPGALFKFRVRGWEGEAAFSEREARAMAERCGFEMRYHHGTGERGASEHGAGGQDYWLWFFKRAGGKGR